jgi:hypothetical protein
VQAVAGFIRAGRRGAAMTLIDSGY